jgi:hypothetical protein
MVLQGLVRVIYGSGWHKEESDNRYNFQERETKSVYFNPNDVSESGPAATGVMKPGARRRS